MPAPLRDSSLSKPAAAPENAGLPPSGGCFQGKRQIWWIFAEKWPHGLEAFFRSKGITFMPSSTSDRWAVASAAGCLAHFRQSRVPSCAGTTRCGCRLISRFSPVRVASCWPTSWCSSSAAYPSSVPFHRSGWPLPTMPSVYRARALPCQCTAKRMINQAESQAAPSSRGLVSQLMVENVTPGSVAWSKGGPR